MTETKHGISDADALAILESGEGFDFEHAESTPLGDIWVARRERDEAEDELTRAVLAGRASGLSWDQIAVGLQISRQGARQKYMDRTEPGGSTAPDASTPTEKRQVREHKRAAAKQRGLANAAFAKSGKQTRTRTKVQP